MIDMKVGDLGFFYHSNCKTPGIIGVVKVGFYRMEMCQQKEWVLMGQGLTDGTFEI